MKRHINAGSVISYANPTLHAVSGKRGTEKEMLFRTIIFGVLKQNPKTNQT